MFGMGTGGSLRLLSPEIGQGPNPLATARFGFVGSAIQLPPDFLLTRSLLLSLSLAAQGFAPSKPHRLDFPSVVRPRQPPFFPTFFFLSQTFFQGFRFPFPAPRSALASPVPCSLLPSPSLQDQALDLLVSPSSIHYCTSTDDLSTLSSSRGLTCF